jgi:hypothetical protein
LDPDPVIDFQIMEAVGIKVAKEDEAIRKEQEKKDWKKRGSDELDQYR